MQEKEFENTNALLKPEFAFESENSDLIGQEP